ncbi:MAG: sulfotransferase [Magnetococcales bacterium]|nr:sulfotransferase [Magnetococcales bacterium]
MDRIKEGSVQEVLVVCDLIEMMARSGDFEGAVKKCKLALWQTPRSGELHCAMAGILRRQKKFKESIKYYQKAVELAPEAWSGLYGLGDLLLEMMRADEAEALFLQALNTPSGKRSEVYHALGRALMVQYRTKEAVAAYQQGVLLNPNSPILYRNLGNALRELGQFDAAITAYKSGLAIDPDDPWLYAVLTSVKKYVDKSHPDLVAMVKLLDKNELNAQEAIELHFALGKAFDHCESYTSAFSHYQNANQIRYQLQEGSDLSDVLALIERIKTVFTPELFNKLKDLGTTDKWPVFIVGMFRSGTSLTEQILASHTKVYGAGERVEMGVFSRELPSRLNVDEPFPECIEHLSATVAKEVASAYRDALWSGVDADTLRIVDKLPFNFLHLGLIALLFPKAHIIHCQRHPLDVCLSIYFQNFAGGHKFMQNLEDIAYFYRAYHDLMIHWEKVLGLSIHTVVYESLVADPELYSRALIEKIGLEWDDKCLTPDKTNRAVQSASSWQVRQPIYRSSSYRWLNYEEHLEPVKSILAELLPKSDLSSNL